MLNGSQCATVQAYNSRLNWMPLTKICFCLPIVVPSVLFGEIKGVLIHVGVDTFPVCLDEWLTVPRVHKSRRQAVHSTWHLLERDTYCSFLSCIILVLLFSKLAFLYNSVWNLDKLWPGNNWYKLEYSAYSYNKVRKASQALPPTIKGVAHVPIAWLDVGVIGGQWGWL